MQEMDEMMVLLLYKQVTGQELDKEETTALRQWLEASPQNQSLLEGLAGQEQLEQEIKELLAIDEDAALKKLQDRIAREKRRFGGPLLLMRFAAAILLVLAVGTGIFIWLSPSAGIAKKDGSARRFKNDIAPGGDSALLQEADGYKTVSTPRKGRYHLQLPDGSKVWLNAASSLRFPAAFAAGRREVELSGEAYFEVASQTLATGKKIPFIVNIHMPAGNAGDVEVLGTRFNINAYADETAVRTMLVDGRVLFHPALTQQSPVELHPGQEAALEKDGSVRLQNPPVDEITAWKDDLFLFQDTDIETIMRMISRWYDVDIVYDGKITQTFNGKISRNVPLSKLLDILELTGGVYFTLDGKKITVKNQQ